MRPRGTAWSVLITRGSMRRPASASAIPAQPELAPPGKAHAETFAVRERYGVVWVALGEPRATVPEFAVAEQRDSAPYLRGRTAFARKGPRVIENLLDVAHLGFVHAGLLGDPQRGEVEDYEVTAGRQRARTGGEEDPHLAAGSRRHGEGRALVNYHYWVAGPLTAGFVKSHGEQRFGILAQVAPVDEDTASRGW